MNEIKETLIKIANKLDEQQLYVEADRLTKVAQNMGDYSDETVSQGLNQLGNDIGQMFQQKPAYQPKLSIVLHQVKGLLDASAKIIEQLEPNARNIYTAYFNQLDEANARLEKTIQEEGNF